MMIATKELIGWTVFGRHYRLRSPLRAVALRVIDSLGALLFCLKKRRLRTPPSSIVIIQLDHIGDMLLAGNTIRDLRKAYPNAKISVVIREMTEQIANMVPEIDEILCLNTPWLSRTKRITWFGVAAFCARRFKTFDLAIDLHGDPRNNFIAWALGRFSVGFGLRGGGFFLNKDVPWNTVYNKHIVEIQALLLDTVGAKASAENYALTIPPEATRRAGKLLSDAGVQPGEFVFVQMSSGAPIKDWPLEHWKKAIEGFLATSAVVTADQDTNKVTYISNTVKNDRFIALQLDLPEYFAVLSLARMVLAVDTFASHAAACLQKPLIAFYSGTNLVEEWGPYRATHATVRQDTQCEHFPCGFRECPFGHPSPCMKRLEWSSANI